MEEEHDEKEEAQEAEKEEEEEAEDFKKEIYSKLKASRRGLSLIKRFEGLSVSSKA